MSNGKHDWGNYWQGRAGSDGEALVGIENSAELKNFWEDKFANISRSARVLDLACGAGSVLRHASRLGFSDLSGLDISAHAIAAMLEKFPAAKSRIAPVSDTGLKAGNYDIIVSQFGFEYAGNMEEKQSACSEIARLMAKGGRFIALCHIKNGAISDEVNLHLRQIEKIQNSKFIGAAKSVFIALERAEKSPDQTAADNYHKAVAELAGPRDNLTAFIGSSSGHIKGLAKHLLAGTAQLFDKRKAYELEDIIGWLDGMENEILAYKGRMASQKKAALSEQDIEILYEKLQKSGLETLRAETLTLSGDARPAAWILQAKKPD